MDFMAVRQSLWMCTNTVHFAFGPEGLFVKTACVPTSSQRCCPWQAVSQVFACVSSMFAWPLQAVCQTCACVPSLFNWLFALAGYM